MPQTTPYEERSYPMRKIKCFLLVMAVLLLCACGRAAPPSAPEPTPTPTPAPTPTPTPAPTSYTLTDETEEEILALAAFSSLQTIDATASREYEALLALRTLLPDCLMEWTYELNGESVSSLCEELTLNSTSGLAEGLRYLPSVKTVDLLACEVPDEEKDTLISLYPEVDFLWNVKFGRWEVRSDIVIFSTLNSSDSPRLSDQVFAPLFKYCRHLKALDLGHNALRDLSLLGTLSELQVLILADNPYLKDISPLAGLTELRYLELFSCTSIEDFSCFRTLEKMEDLNICFAHKLTDVSVFDNMPDLKVCWFRYTGLSKEDKEAFSAAHPDAKVLFSGNFDHSSATGGGWRATEENVAVRTAFKNWRYVTRFDYYDVLEFIEGSTVYPAKPSY